MRAVAIVLVLAGAPTCQSQGSGGRGDPTPPAPRRLRVATLNTHSFQEGDDSLAKIEQIGRTLAALDVDIAALNEMMSGTFWAFDFDGEQYDATAIIEEAAETASGRSWYSAGFGFAHWDDGEMMSNVILAAHPLGENDSRALTTTDFWPAPDEQRNVGFARVDVPGVGPVAFFVTHTWGWGSADTTAQIAEVEQFAATTRRDSDELTVLAGDLNIRPGSDAYWDWIEDPPIAFVDTYAEANPWGFEDATTFDGDARIDYILAPRSAAKWSCTSELAFDGQNGPRVSDHKGVVTVFEIH